MADLMPDPMTRWTAAMRAERYADAWAIADATLAARDPATRDDPTLPYHRRWVWDGQPVDGARVLVRCYHGLGDTLQYARFLPALAARAARVAVEAQGRLLPLLATITDAVTFMAFDEAHPLPPADVDLDLTEIDHALRLRPADAPAPYLSADPAPLPPGTVAVCHGAGDWDRARAIPPALLAPLAAHAPLATLMPGPSPLPVLNPEGCPMDMAATAALVAGAALVVTVDTMIAHLAGALGRPTWLLLKHEPDWRWNPAARTTPWYASMRLYAQDRAGDWTGVAAAVQRDLATLPRKAVPA